MEEWYEGFYFTKDEINSQTKITEKAKQALDVRHEYSSVSKVAIENYNKENNCLEYMKNHHKEEKDQPAFSEEEIKTAKAEVNDLENQYDRISNSFGDEALKISKKLKNAKNRYNHMVNINNLKVHRLQQAKEAEQAATNLVTLQENREQNGEPNDETIKEDMEKFKNSNEKLEKKYNNLTTNRPDKYGIIKVSQIQEIENTVRYVKDNKYKMSLLDKKVPGIQDKLSKEKKSQEGIQIRIDKIEHSSFFNKIKVFFTGEKRGLKKELDEKNQKIKKYENKLSNIPNDKAAYIKDSKTAIDKMFPISQEKLAALNALKTDLNSLVVKVDNLFENTKVTRQIDSKFDKDLTNLRNSINLLSKKIEGSIQTVQDLAKQKNELATMSGQSTFIDLTDNAKEKQSEISSQGKQPEKSQQKETSERGSSLA